MSLLEKIDLNPIRSLNIGDKIAYIVNGVNPHVDKRISFSQWSKNSRSYLSQDLENKLSKVHIKMNSSLSEINFLNDFFHELGHANFYLQPENFFIFTGGSRSPSYHESLKVDSEFHAYKNTLNEFLVLSEYWRFPLIVFTNHLKEKVSAREDYYGKAVQKLFSECKDDWERALKILNQ